MHAQKLCKIFFQSLCLLHSYHIQAKMRVVLPLVTRHATTDKPIRVQSPSLCRCLQTAKCVSSSFVLNFLTWLGKKIEGPYLESLLFNAYQHFTSNVDMIHHNHNHRGHNNHRWALATSKNLFHPLLHSGSLLQFLMSTFLKLLFAISILLALGLPAFFSFRVNDMIKEN